MQIQIPVSVGELWDKITILELKCELITDPDRLKLAREELSLLKSIEQLHCPPNPNTEDLRAELAAVNRELWHIEEGKRRCEQTGQFGEFFISMARKVYLKNDRRAELKRHISQAYGSEIQEVKSYAKYGYDATGQ